MNQKLLPLLLTAVMCVDPEVFIAQGEVPPIDNFSSIEEEADKYHGLSADLTRKLCFKLNKE